ncbi:major histocompatibility complex class I-related gene protein-like [Neolamprologus brichardi]|uniref:major histocompatibility complex class I-related gene protein-like n=1 Tax=Neolamprologus brichardi TaxID=32507 RepID=UPI001643F6C8|nr:major histocompatibility complex class I-related gene protein-like [Neolamprologus brichardi]
MLNMVVKLMILFLLCHPASAVSNILKYFVTGGSGHPNISEFMYVGVLDGIEVVYCDASKKILEPRQDWVKKLFDDKPDIFEGFTQGCFEAHCIIGNEWNKNSGEVTGFLHFGYDREGIFDFDLNTKTWIPLKPELYSAKPMMGGDRITYTEALLRIAIPYELTLFLDYGSSALNKTVFPSVSLLQKTPSSPVSCHATGFYPDKAMMFWRKDGVEIHEGVDPGEILPNNDGTFQMSMSVDLNVSSVTTEDWSRYDCVFQLSDGEDNIITSLNKTMIRTNWVENITKERSLHMMIVAAVVVSVVFVIIGLYVFKKKRERKSEQSK